MATTEKRKEQEEAPSDVEEREEREEHRGSPPPSPPVLQPGSSGGDDKSTQAGGDEEEQPPRRKKQRHSEQRVSPHSRSAAAAPDQPEAGTSGDMTAGSVERRFRTPGGLRLELGDSVLHEGLRGTVFEMPTPDKTIHVRLIDWDVYPSDLGLCVDWPLKTTKMVAKALKQLLRDLTFPDVVEPELGETRSLPVHVFQRRTGCTRCAIGFREMSRMVED